MIFGDVLSGIVDNCSMSVLQSRLKYSNNIQKTISLPKKKTEGKILSERGEHLKTNRSAKSHSFVSGVPNRVPHLGGATHMYAIEEIC